MSGFSTVLENRVLSYAFLGSSLTPIATHKLALYTSAPSDAGGGTEVTGGSYARQTVLFQAGGTAGLVENSAQVTFTGLPACTITHVGVWGDGGTFIAWGALDVARAFNLGDTTMFDVGELKFDLD